MSATADSVRDSDTVNITVDGVAMKARRGEMLIESADAAGFNIPRFCYHKKLSVAANCRMCLVEVEKVPKPLPACATPVTEGMKVYTRSPKAIEAQRGTMEFLLINHPLDCPICDQGGECELQEVSIGFGNDKSEFSELKRVVADKNIGPLIETEMTRCIHCTRCVRFGDEIAGIRELGATGRGERTRIGTYVETTVSSELSGNVIDLCPVGALTSKPFRYTARAWEMERHVSIAAHDCAGSNVQVLARRNEVMRVDPQENEQINEVWLSDRDRFSYQALNSNERLTSPMIRQDGKWVTTDWNTALEVTVKGLQEVIAQQGADQFGALISPNATVEEAALAAKLTRALGSAHIDHRLRQQDFSAQDQDPVYPWLGQSIEALEEQQAILLVGSNIQKEQPIIGHRIRKASLKGAHVMALNALDYAFNFIVEQKRIAAPSQWPAELAAIASAAVAQAKTDVSDEVKQILANVEVTESHREIASNLIEHNSTLLLGNQASMHPQYSLLKALAAVIANACKAQLGFLSDGANSAGASLAGALPHRTVGGVRAEVTGLDARSMLEQGLKAYLLLNIEAEYDCASPHTAIDALMDAQFVVSLSAYHSTAMEKYADVILPITPVTETSGTFVNCEGRWQSFTAAVTPLGEARPAWKVLRVLGNLFDMHGFEYLSSEEILREIKQAAEKTAIDNIRQWPVSALPPSGGGLERIASVPLYSVDSTVRRAGALQLTSDAGSAVVSINANEARRLGLQDASQVIIEQDGEQIRLPLQIDNRLADGSVLLPTAVSGTEQLSYFGLPLQLSGAKS